MCDRRDTFQRMDGLPIACVYTLDLPTGVRTLLADASDASDASFHMNSPRAHAHARRAHTILSVGSVGSVGKVGRGVEIFST